MLCWKHHISSGRVFSRVSMWFRALAVVAREEGRPHTSSCSLYSVSLLRQSACLTLVARRVERFLALLTLVFEVPARTNCSLSTIAWKICEKKFSSCSRDRVEIGSHVSRHEKVVRLRLPTEPARAICSTDKSLSLSPLDPPTHQSYPTSLEPPPSSIPCSPCALLKQVQARATGAAEGVVRLA